MITILDKEGVCRAIRRLASEVVERNRGTEGLVLVGIKTRGVTLANRLQKEIARLEGKLVPVGVLDIAMHRDEEGREDAVLCGSDVHFDLDGMNVALCDDIMYTGRTVRTAISALTAMGAPRTVRLYTLVDRGHRELPFRADAVGKSVPTAKAERLLVHFVENDGEDGVQLCSRSEKN